MPFGPFAIVWLGVWCARAPGPRLRLWSVPVPLPRRDPAVFTTLPPSRWEWTVRADGGQDPPAHRDDLLGCLLVYIGGITVLPRLLGHGVTRLLRFARARRARPGQGAARRPPTPTEGPSGGVGAG